MEFLLKQVKSRHSLLGSMLAYETWDQGSKLRLDIKMKIFLRLKVNDNCRVKFLKKKKKSVVRSRRGLVGSVLARVRVPGQISKRNTKSISSAISSQQISGKNAESKLKNCHEKFLKKSVVRSQL